MNGKNGSAITRREFARRAAIVSAVSLVPSHVLPAHVGTTAPLPPQSPDVPQLSPESQAEADARYQSILTVYRSRFSDTQTADLYRLSLLAQAPLDHLRAQPIENDNGPALYLKPLVEREKKPEATEVPRTSSKPARKS